MVWIRIRPVTEHSLFTVAQVPYESRITKTTEYQPICISLMGRKGRSQDVCKPSARDRLPWRKRTGHRALTYISTPGSDLSLLRLAEEALRTAGWHTGVETGRYTFPIGDDGRHAKEDQGGHGGGQGAAPIEPQHAKSVMGTTTPQEPLGEL